MKVKYFRNNSNLATKRIFVLIIRTAYTTSVVTPHSLAELAWTIKIENIPRRLNLLRKATLGWSRSTNKIIKNTYRTGKDYHELSVTRDIRCATIFQYFNTSKLSPTDKF